MAKQHPGLEAEWTQLETKGDLAAFQEFQKQKEAQGIFSFTPFLRVIDVYRNSGLSPWIVVTDDTTKRCRAVPGAWLFLNVVVTFDVPGHNRQVTGKVSDTTIRPNWASVPGRGSEVRIFRGFKGAEKKEVSAIVVERGAWVRVPLDAPAGEMQLTLSVNTEGDRDGVRKTVVERRAITVRIVRNVQPTRLQMFCLWDRAVQAGTWLGKYPAGDVKLAKVNRQWVEWSHSYLVQFAAMPDAPNSRLAKTLLENETYKAQVLPRLSK